MELVETQPSKPMHHILQLDSVPTARTPHPPKTPKVGFLVDLEPAKLEIIQASIHKWLIAGFVKDLNSQLRMPDENIQEWCLHLLGLETSVEGPETLNSER